LIFSGLKNKGPEIKKNSFFPKVQPEIDVKRYVSMLLHLEWGKAEHG
jgi:hypothetical protein